MLGLCANGDRGSGRAFLGCGVLHQGQAMQLPCWEDFLMHVFPASLRAQVGCVRGAGNVTDFSRMGWGGMGWEVSTHDTAGKQPEHWQCDTVVVKKCPSLKATDHAAGCGVCFARLTLDCTDCVEVCSGLSCRSMEAKPSTISSTTDLKCSVVVGGR